MPVKSPELDRRRRPAADDALTEASHEAPLQISDRGRLLGDHLSCAGPSCDQHC